MKLTKSQLKQIIKEELSQVLSLVESASTYLVSAVATVIINESGQALILRRGPTAPWMPGKWNLPGGVVDPGESLRQAAIREVIEETTLRVRSSSPLTTIDHTAEEWAAAFFISGPDEWSGKVRLDYENDAFAWISEPEISGYSFIPTVKEGLMRAFQ
jgi:8-oxo-dGTP diphosphatase